MTIVFYQIKPTDQIMEHSQRSESRGKSIMD